MNKNTYLATHYEGFKNGSVIRVTGRKKKDRFAVYNLGDFIGFINEIPSEYVYSKSWKEAKQILPFCFLG